MGKRIKFVALFLVFHALIGLDQAQASEEDLKTGVSAKTTTEASDLASDSQVHSRFSLGIGGGVNTFSGNLGKLYASTSPSFDFRIAYAWNRFFTAKAGVDLGKFASSMPPNGFVEASLTQIGLALQYFPISNSIFQGGRSLDPYVFAEASNAIRKQIFQDFGTQEQDSALGFGLGLGAMFSAIPKQFALWAEAGASQILFQDRYLAEYSSSGIEDKTGMLLSGKVGINYFF